MADFLENSVYNFSRLAGRLLGRVQSEVDIFYLVALVHLHCNRSRRERQAAFTNQRAIPRLLPSAFPVCLP